MYRLASGVIAANMGSGDYIVDCDRGYASSEFWRSVRLALHFSYAKICICISIL